MRLRHGLALNGVVLPAAFVAGAIVAGGLLFERSLWRALDESLRAQAAVESVSLFDGAAPHLHVPQPRLFQDPEHVVSSRAIYDAKGEQLLVEDVLLPAPDRLMPVSRTTARTLVRPSGLELRELLVPVRAPDGARYTLWLARPTEPLRATVRAYFQTTGLTALVALLLLIVLQWRFASRLSLRIGRLVEHMERLVRGALKSRPAPDDHADELGALRESINTATERLDAAALAQERLIADAAHELRTPLASMRAMMDVTLRKERSPEELKEALCELREEVDRLGALSTKVLELARGRHARWMMIEGDLRALVEQALEGFKERAAQQQLSLVLRAPARAIARFDPDGLRQALDNLLSNAIKFSPPGAQVLVELSAREGRFFIAVEDEGPGVPEAERLAVFEPFRRLDKTKEGAGLGLTIARELVARHGGELLVESAGRGARFFMWIPAEA